MKRMEIEESRFGMSLRTSSTLFGVYGKCQGECATHGKRTHMTLK